ncbi:MAG: hypothetical protein ACTHM6_03225 [Tepidisphaeraceae bacterium]
MVELTESQKKVAAALGFVVVTGVVALIMLVRQFHSATPGNSEQAYFSYDEGKSYFVGNPAEIPPENAQGQQAAEVFFFQCAGDSKPFVGYLQRVSAEGMARAKAALAHGQPSQVTAAMEGAYEVKAPGAKEWVNLSDAKAASIMSPKCPSGTGTAVRAANAP